MKLAFFGTSSFSVAILEKLINDFYQPTIVISQPDKPVGRNQALTPPPVKEICFCHNINILQPNKLMDEYQKLKSLELDLIVVAEFGKIVPQEILDLPKYGVINVHTSLLPKYRGASPIQNAILNGEEMTGVTIMKMDAELDHGDIIFQRKIDIDEYDNYRTIYSNLAKIGAETLVRIIPDYVKGKLVPRKQNHDEASFTQIIKKDDAKIDWNQSAEQCDRMIRAYYGWPCAWTILPDGKRLKIYNGHINKDLKSLQPGRISFTDHTVSINCLDNVIELDLVQVEGKSIIPGKDFASGYQRFHKQLAK